jgi:hypothetical protein
MKNRTCISMYLPNDIYKKFKDRSVKNRRSMSGQMEILVREYLAEDADLDTDEMHPERMERIREVDERDKGVNAVYEKPWSTVEG